MLLSLRRRFLHLSLTLRRAQSWCVAPQECSIATPSALLFLITTHALTALARSLMLLSRTLQAANAYLNPLFEPRIRIVDKCVSHERSSVTMKGDPGASWSSILFFDDKVSGPQRR